MLDESSPNGPCRGSPCSALGWEMGISAIRVEGGTYLCPKALGPPRGAQQPSYSQGSSLHGCSPDIDPTWGFLPGAKDFRANGNAPVGTH